MLVMEYMVRLLLLVLVLVPVLLMLCCCGMNNARRTLWAAVHGVHPALSNADYWCTQASSKHTNTTGHTLGWLHPFARCRRLAIWRRTQALGA